MNGWTAERSGDLRAAGIFLRELREQIRLLADIAATLAAIEQDQAPTKIQLKWSDEVVIYDEEIKRPRLVKSSFAADERD